MTIKTPSAEACQGCQTSNNPAPDVKQPNSAVTYNDGQGIKDRVVLSGPLSQVLAQQLNVIFQKQVLTVDENPPQPELPSSAVTVEETQTPAVETYAQDSAIQAAFINAASQPDNRVILGNFDVTSIRDHVSRMQTNVTNASDTQDVTDIPVLVVSEDDLLDSAKLMDYQLSSTDELLVVSTPEQGSTTGEYKDRFMVRNTKNAITRALTQDPEPQMPGESPNAITVSEKAQAIERMYGRQVKRIHFGVEAFIASLAKRVCA